MLKDNLVSLRNLAGYSQEEIAEKIGISRQAYGKWEKGETIPDVVKCARLAEVYDTTVDDLLKANVLEGQGSIPPAPRGKKIFGSVHLSDRGQVSIPKAARDFYGLNPGDRLVVLGDEIGIAFLPEKSFMEGLNRLAESAQRDSEAD